MAYATAVFEHPVMGMTRIAPVGFSWTTFFFGPFPALMRQHWAGAGVILLAALVTFWFSSIIFAFFYNRWYIRHLAMDGWRYKSGTIDKAALEAVAGLRLKAAPREADDETA